MTNEERQQMRAAIAEENGFALYRQYNEESAAAFLKIDVSTLKRWRRAKKVEYVAMGDRGVRYMGYQIADIISDGAKDRTSVLDELAGKLNEVRKA
jgi:hypothetical protein